MSPNTRSVIMEKAMAHKGPSTTTWRASRPSFLPRGKGRLFQVGERSARHSKILRNAWRIVFSTFLLLPLLVIILTSCSSEHTDQEHNRAGPHERIPLPDMGPADPFSVKEERGVVLVRDDPHTTKLYADIFRPDGEGRFPALLEVVAYRREIFTLGRAPDPRFLASQGYAVVVVDARGTGSSEGKWGAFSEDEIQDVVWIVDSWIPSQPWSNGKVGMFGPSYMGIIQLLTAGRHPSHLKAIFPGVAMADAYRDIFYQGGIFNQEFILFWALATIGLSLLPGTQLAVDPFSALKALKDHLEALPELLSWLQMTTDQEFFWMRSPMHYWSDLTDIPVFMSAGWFCIFTRGSLLNYVGLTDAQSSSTRARTKMPAPRKIIVGPWYHVTGALLEGIPSEHLHKRWFDWHLKADDDPLYPYYDILDPAFPVLLYVMGEERWRKETEWPPPRVRYETLYLSGERQVYDQNISLNNGSLIWTRDLNQQALRLRDSPPTEIRHQPPQYAGRYSRSPCRWLVGFPSARSFSEDERVNETRTLTFSTSPLQEDIEVTGPLVVRLWAQTHFEALPAEQLLHVNGLDASFATLFPMIVAAVTEPDVHWIINVNDVLPDGRVRNITSGWLAGSHRPDPTQPDWTQPGYDPFHYPQDIEPRPVEDGTLYEYVIEVWPTSHVFKKGHQIRIDVANSDVPHLLPSLVPSTSRIFHDPDHPSRLVIPVVDKATTDPSQWIDDPEAYVSGAAPWSTHKLSTPNSFE